MYTDAKYIHDIIAEYPSTYIYICLDCTNYLLALYNNHFEIGLECVTLPIILELMGSVQAPSVVPSAIDRTCYTYIIMASKHVVIYKKGLEDSEIDDSEVYSLLISLQLTRNNIVECRYKLEH